ncbi:MAG: class I lanthipeptide [Hyphomicrobiales bacterium]
MKKATEINRKLSLKKEAISNLGVSTKSNEQKTASFIGCLITAITFFSAGLCYNK